MSCCNCCCHCCGCRYRVVPNHPWWGVVPPSYTNEKYYVPTIWVDEVTLTFGTSQTEEE